MTTAARVMLLLGLFLSLVSAPAFAYPVTYTDFVTWISVQINSTTYSCTSFSDPNCAFVTITASGDTSTVFPFSVVGASGFKNTALGPATVSIDFNGGGNITETLVAGQIYASVDNTNGGAGFGSSYGPTYPAATYGGTANYATYNLQTNFLASGFSGFCPDPTTCNTYQPLTAVSGDLVTLYYPFRPNASYFQSVVTAPTTPEPATGSLALVGMGYILRRIRRKRTF
jgi:hypothetical protein